MSFNVALDGRAARRDRNRTAVLDAMIEMFSEGDLEPTPDDVARRVGISGRSVYRYFDDRESLLRCAIERQLESVWHLYLIPKIGQGPRHHRIDDFAARRLQLYEVAGSAARAARARAVTDQIVREQVELTRRALREQIERHFATELDAMTPRVRRSRVAALDALGQFETLDHFRIHRGFSRTETRDLLIDTLTHLLTN